MNGTKTTIEVEEGFVDLVESEQRPPGEVFGMVAPVDAPDPVGDQTEPDGALWVVLRAPSDAPMGSDAGDLWKDSVHEALTLAEYGLWDARS